MMKLKILPPTLREKKRYIAVQIYSQFRMDKDNLIPYLWDNLIKLYGEIYSSNINLWLINFKYTQRHPDGMYEYKCLLKCQRGYEDDVCLMLDTLAWYENKRIVAHILSVSGTIKTLDSKYDLL